MLVELIKNKNNTPYDYHKEIIDNYRKMKNELDVYKLQECAKIYSNGEKKCNSKNISRYNTFKNL